MSQRVTGATVWAGSFFARNAKAIGIHTLCYLNFPLLASMLHLIFNAAFLLQSITTQSKRNFLPSGPKNTCKLSLGSVAFGPAAICSSAARAHCALHVDEPRAMSAGAQMGPSLLASTATVASALQPVRRCTRIAGPSRCAGRKLHSSLSAP